MDSYSITEKRGKHHGSIRVGRLGLDGIIACLVELCRCDFSKQHFFKRFHEKYKIFECSSRWNKGVFFFFLWKYLSIILGQDVVVCVSQKDFIRVARLFLKGSCVIFSWKN